MGLFPACPAEAQGAKGEDSRRTLVRSARLSALAEYGTVLTAGEPCRYGGGGKNKGDLSFCVP